MVLRTIYIKINLISQQDLIKSKRTVKKKKKKIYAYFIREGPD